jgi:hypothetical protein
MSEREGRRVYYRMQEKGISFKDMMNWVSTDWGTGESCGEGLAACDTPDALKWLAREWYGHNLPHDQEVVIFWATPIRYIGDGWLVNPCSECDRVDLNEFMEGYP